LSADGQACRMNGQARQTNLQVSSFPEIRHACQQEG
jgi:hypothetical protein